MNVSTSSSKQFCDLLSTIIDGKTSNPTPLSVLYSRITKNEDKFFSHLFWISTLKPFTKVLVLALEIVCSVGGISNHEIALSECAPCSVNNIACQGVTFLLDMER